MNPFWSQTARELSPYVPGEQPRIANLVKLNTNESGDRRELVQNPTALSLVSLRIPPCYRCHQFVPRHADPPHP